MPSVVGPITKAAAFAALVQAAHVDWGAGTELTIVSGAITQDGNEDNFFFAVDTEGDAATDDLATITRDALAPEMLIIHPANDTRTVVVKHGTGNIKCLGNADIPLDDAHDLCILIYDGSNWFALSGGGSGGFPNAADIWIQNVGA